MNNYKQENRERILHSSFPLVLFTYRTRSLPLLVRTRLAVGYDLAEEGGNRSESSGSTLFNFRPILKLLRRQ